MGVKQAYTITVNFGTWNARHSSALHFKVTSSERSGLDFIHERWVSYNGCMPGEGKLGYKVCTIHVARTWHCTISTVIPSHAWQTVMFRHVLCASCICFPESFALLHPHAHGPSGMFCSFRGIMCTPGLHHLPGRPNMMPVVIQMLRSLPAKRLRSEPQSYQR